jgi:hypothetical protein
MRPFLLFLFTAIALFGQQQPTSPAPPPSKAELKKQKKAEKKAAKEAARAAREASDHLTVPLIGWTSKTASGDPGCVALSDMAFRRDIVRGWGGLLNGGNNAFLGVTSTVTGVVNNSCARESIVAISADFYDTSGLLLGTGSMQILVPGLESRSFQLPWSCPNGVNYTPIGGDSVVWVPNCPAGTARYGVVYQ